MTPFTYLVIEKATGIRYYGVRCSKNADPSQLWTTYFTSSKVVKKLVKLHGKEAFEVRVRKTFPTQEAALRWEHKVLRRLNAAQSNRWYNRHNGGKKFVCTGHSEETRLKLSHALKGKKKSAEHRAKIAAKSTWKGKVTQEQIANKKVYKGSEWLAHHAEGVKRMRESKIGLKRVYREDGTYYMSRDHIQ